MKYEGRLSYSLNTGKVEQGMDVPYKEYLRHCKESGCIPYADYLYPQYQYKKIENKFVVEAGNLKEAAQKIADHKDARKAFGKSVVALKGDEDFEEAGCRELNRMKLGKGSKELSDGDVLFLTFHSDNPNLGWHNSLVVHRLEASEQEKIIFIDCQEMDLKSR